MGVAGEDVQNDTLMTSREWKIGWIMDSAYLFRGKEGLEKCC